MGLFLAAACGTSTGPDIQPGGEDVVPSGEDVSFTEDVLQQEDQVADHADQSDPGSPGEEVCPGPDCGCEPVELCDDGQDNDEDGQTNCRDEDCDGQVGPLGQECQPYGETACEDLVDNDGDWNVDCADDDCDGENGPDDQVCEPGGEVTCDDDLDNDGDQEVDCLDLDCVEEPVCLQACPATQTPIGCDEVVTPEGTGIDSHIDLYGCTSMPEYGPEAVYVFTPAQDIKVIFEELYEYPEVGSVPDRG